MPSLKQITKKWLYKNLEQLHLKKASQPSSMKQKKALSQNYSDLNRIYFKRKNQWKKRLKMGLTLRVPSLHRKK